MAGDATKTSILTVDDDPEVSRAIARDLRRRYGSDDRIIRAESGDQALEALRESNCGAIWSRCCWRTTGCPR